MAPRIALIQGANMEYLGQRQPEFYGTTTAEELDSMCNSRASSLGLELDIYYSNLEGEAIGHLYELKRDRLDGIVMNPAGFLYAGSALADCLLAVNVPYVEVHMTNIEARGKTSVTAPVCTGMITGLGVTSYTLALDAIANLIADGQTTLTKN